MYVGGTERLTVPVVPGVAVYTRVTGRQQVREMFDDCLMTRTWKYEEILGSESFTRWLAGARAGARKMF